MLSESLSTPAESPLPSGILRCLGDRSYEKRKNAALEIETLVKAFNQQNDTDRICSVIGMLGQDFATSTNSNHRKGALIGLAATAIGLMGNTRLYLDALLPPVLHCLDDHESRVRYYSCESLYNISKVARGDILRFFNQIFDGLCKLFADVDLDVRNGASLLDRLVKDIVGDSESFDVENFIPLLQKYIRRSNPYLRQLLVNWLPDFLDGLFNMLSDSNREIRQAAFAAISGFLVDIKKAGEVDFGPMVGILVSQCRNKERFNRLTAITWLREFINLGKIRLLLFYSELLGSIMYCISDDDLEIRRVAGLTNIDFLDLVKGTASGLELSPILQTLTNELGSSHIPTRLASLRWINMLLDKVSMDICMFISELLPALLTALCDESDEVVLTTLEALARISLLSEAEFQRVLESVVDVFAADRRVLELRGPLIIRNLCLLLDAKAIYLSFANILTGSGHDGKKSCISDLISQRACRRFTDSVSEELDFRSVMVQTLSLILLTSRELAELRIMLRSSSESDVADENAYVFATLFCCWSYNPVATLSLCLIAESYRLSSSLVVMFSQVDVTVNFLMQVDKLVQLLESPIFINLRLQLLDVCSPNHPFLLKSLYGILMLLPQSSAFRILSSRLSTVASFQLHANCSSQCASEASPSLHLELLHTFRRIQNSGMPNTESLR